VKALPVAQYLVQEILNLSTEDSQPEVQGSKKPELGTNSKRQLRKQLDSSTYWLPKSQPDIPGDGAEDSHGASSDSSLVSDDPAMCQHSHDDMTISNDSPVVEKLLQECEGDIPEIVEEIPREGVHGRCMPMGSESTWHQLEVMHSSNGAKKNSAHGRPLVTLDKSPKDSHTTVHQSGAEQQETVSLGIDGKAFDDQATLAPSLPHGTKPQETALLGPPPSTPVRQIDRGVQSPPSNGQTATPDTALFTPIGNGEIISPLTEVDRTASLPDKVEMTLLERFPFSPSWIGQQQASLCNPASTYMQQVDGEQLLLSQDSQTMLSFSPPREALTLTDMVAKAVHIIYEMSRRQEVPTEIHSTILSTLRPNIGGTPTPASVAEQPGSIWSTSSPTAWSASMWINMLEAGHARSKEITILNMIEWMGASEWYDAELARAEKAPPPTKRGTPRKRLATVVLDRYLIEAPNTTAAESPGKLALKDNEDYLSSPNSTGIQRRIFDTRRKKLNKIFHRGRTLRKLIQMTHLGILFHPDIWYVLRYIH
jgi:hypothetical protein